MQNKNYLLVVVASILVALVSTLNVTISFAQNEPINPITQTQEHLADVQNFTASAGLGSVVLKWDAVPDANAYTIYYGTKSVATDGGNYEQEVAISNVTTYTVSNLTGGTQYHFTIAAEDTTKIKLGSINYSAEITATPTAAVANSNTALPLPITENDATVIEATSEKTPETKESAPTPEDLSKSGPEAILLLLGAGVGSVAWRKAKKIFARK